MRRLIWKHVFGKGLCPSPKSSPQHVTGVKAQYYPSFGEAQLSIGIGATEKSGDQHTRSEMEGLLNELS
jgi:hypothetical protein